MPPPICLPPFSPNEALTWFQRAETQFRLKNIVKATTKADHIMAVLPEKVFHWITPWDHNPKQVWQEITTLCRFPTKDVEGKYHEVDLKKEIWLRSLPGNIREKLHDSNEMAIEVLTRANALMEDHRQARPQSAAPVFPLASTDINAMRVIPMGGDEVLSQVYKYMFEKVRDAADVLDDVITSLADQMITDLNTEEYSQLRLPSNEAVCAAGRICCDSVGRLNFASVLLEGSREISSGSAVPLDLTHLSEFSLFPGQIVGVRGVNTTGNKLVVQELLPGKVLPPPDSPAIIKNATGAVQVVVASGPFTTTDNLLYEPLTDLLSVLKENPPHMLILLGPLLDAAHPLISDTLFG
ncbi:hypothetical protein C7M84_010632 [Penaeus vannamei]|uniref:DNA polymerase alpha subunit B n=1 Tax=Penaeus vannamei TaxID=6689 RepID=A0A3R7NZB6_PENVA|nr:hypothetical protein C7M84_010632 [Penaeus vannamei]